jgi:hypothetical protein
VDSCRAAEYAETHGKTYLQSSSGKKLDAVHKMHKKTKHQNQKPNTEKTEPSTTALKRPCYYCNKIHDRKKSACPAYGKTCGKCKRLNHFTSACKAKVNMISSETNGSDDDLD